MESQWGNIILWIVCYTYMCQGQLLERRGFICILNHLLCSPFGLRYRTVSTSMNDTNNNLNAANELVIAFYHCVTTAHHYKAVNLLPTYY